ncbi:MAG: hypothetical protein JWP96_1426 [Polaromonas sp.]|nr:hypothetical protein [Polaromonas sp.]
MSRLFAAYRAANKHNNHRMTVTLHPFDDGNGRISRAVGAMALARADGASQRYRRALSEVVAAIVRTDEAATPETISARTPPAVAEADKAHFIALVLAKFKALHAGNAVRFGIGALALAAWRDRHR